MYGGRLDRHSAGTTRIRSSPSSVTCGMKCSPESSTSRGRLRHIDRAGVTASVRPADVLASRA